MSTRQKLTDLANDGVNRLDEDDADELLGVLKENTRLRKALKGAIEGMDALRRHIR